MILHVIVKFQLIFGLFAQDIVRINMTSEKKQFAKNKVLAEAAEKAKAGNGRLHYLGLVSYTVTFVHTIVYSNLKLAIID